MPQKSYIHPSRLALEDDTKLNELAAAGLISEHDVVSAKFRRNAGLSDPASVRYRHLKEQQDAAAAAAQQTQPATSQPTTT
jgi:hypothetical protein